MSIYKVVTLQSVNNINEWNELFLSRLQSLQLPEHISDTYLFVFREVLTSCDNELLSNVHISSETVVTLITSFLVNYNGALNRDWISFLFEQAIYAVFDVAVRTKVVPSRFSLAEISFLSPTEMSELTISESNCFLLSPLDRKRLCSHRVERLNHVLKTLVDDFMLKRQAIMRSILQSNSTPEQFEQAINTGFGKGQYTYSSLLKNKTDYFHFIYRNFQAYRDIPTTTRAKIRSRIGITSEDEMTFLNKMFPNELLVKAVRLMINTTIKLKPNWHQYLSVDNVTKSHVGYKLHFYESTTYGHEREVEYTITNKQVCAGIKVLLNAGEPIRSESTNLLSHLTAKGYIKDGDATRISKSTEAMFKGLVNTLFGVTVAHREMLISNSAGVLNEELLSAPNSKQNKVERIEIKIKGGVYRFDDLDFAIPFLLDVEKHLDSKDIESFTVDNLVKRLRRWLSFSKDNGHTEAFKTYHHRSLESSLINYRGSIESSALNHSSKVAYFNPLVSLLKEMVGIGKIPNFLIPKGFPQPRNNTPKATYLNLYMEFIEGEKEYLMEHYSAPSTLLYTQVSTSPDLVHGVLNFRVATLKKYAASLICEFKKTRDYALKFANKADITAMDLTKRLEEGEKLSTLFPDSITGQRRVYLLFSMGDIFAFNTRNKLADNATIQRVFKKPHSYYQQIHYEIWPNQDVIAACILLFLLETGANPTHVKDIRVCNSIENTDDPNLMQQRWLKNRGTKDEKIADLINPTNTIFSEHNPSALLCMQWLKEVQRVGGNEFLFHCRTKQMRVSRGPKYLSDSLVGKYAISIGLNTDAVNGRIIRNTFLNLKALEENITSAQRAAGHASDGSTFKYMSKEYWQVTAELSIKDFLENLQVLAVENSELIKSNSLGDYDIRLERLQQSGLGIFCRDITDSPHHPKDDDSICGSLDKCMTCENRSPVFIVTKNNIASILAFKEHLESEKERLINQNTGRWLSTWVYYETYADAVLQRVRETHKYSKMLEEASLETANYVFPRLW